MEDKVYTKEEMLAEAEKIASEKVKDATKDGENQKKLDVLKAELDTKTKELEAKDAEAKAAKEKADRLEAEAKAKEEAEKKVALVAKRNETLKAANLEFKKTAEVLAGYLGEWDDTTFENFKSIVIDVAEFSAEAAKEKMTDEEMEKKMKERKEKKTSKSSVVDDSVVVPNAIASESNEFDIFNKILVKK